MGRDNPTYNLNLSRLVVMQNIHIRSKNLNFFYNADYLFCISRSRNIFSILEFITLHFLL